VIGATAVSSYRYPDPQIIERSKKSPRLTLKMIKLSCELYKNQQEIRVDVEEKRVAQPETYIVNL
jgi:hypothetical protein